MITQKTIWGEAVDRQNNDVLWVVGSGAPSNGASGTGNNLTGPGSTYTDISTGLEYLNIGTKASPVWFQGVIEATGAAITSAATIAPTNAQHHITGTVPITTITPPSSTFEGTITLIPDGAFTTGTTGNIAKASTATVGLALSMTYDKNTAKWYPSY